MATLYEILQEMISKKASDLHITTGTPPQMRINGKLQPIDGEPLKPAETKSLVYSILTESQKQKFEEHNELDISFGLKGLARFRANIFNQRGAVAAAIRQIPFEVISPEKLGISQGVIELISRPRGLVLVTGPTGCGKSTTLASLIDKLNSTTHKHIVTIEDPIEYLHTHKKCIVNQREVNTDTHSFTNALKSILRQDPDIVLIGEMRDLETVEAALTISETGHLTFATLHTNSAIQSISRIVDVFPAHQQSQIRAQLSFVLEGIITQQLLPKADGTGRVLAQEVLIPNAAIRNLIRENKIHQIYSTMQTGQDRNGMLTMNQSLFLLVQSRKLTYNEAMINSSSPQELLEMFQRSGMETPGLFQSQEQQKNMKMASGFGIPKK